MLRQQNYNMKSIAFIASTLPVPLVNKNCDVWNLKEVVFTHEGLVHSFQFLKEKNSKIKFVVCPKGYKHWVFLFKKLLLAKIYNNNVFFFHECCWFAFDVLIDLLRIKSNFYPQVGLDSFKKIGGVSHNLPKELMVLKILNVENNFSEYIIPMDNDEGEMHVLSKKVYKRSVTVHTIEESILLRENRYNSYKGTKNILVLIGREPCPDVIVEDIYSSIIEYFSNRGYSVFVKNHPREEARLSLNLNVKYVEIDPFKPVELLENIYLAVIGCASTGLIGFGPHVYSILNFCGMSTEGIIERKKHLTCLSPTLNIKFPLSKNDLIESIILL
jgi:hypothetical protein